MDAIRTLPLVLIPLLLAACGSAPKPQEIEVPETTPRTAPPMVGGASEVDVPEDFADWQHSELTPVLDASQLVDSALLRGPLHELDARVPVSGSMGVFTLHTPFGDYVAEGVELLGIRIHELTAIDRLADQTHLRTFVDATGEAAVRTGRAMASVLGDPVGTVQGLPAGIARFFRQTYRSVRRTTLDVSDAARERSARDKEATQETDEPAGESGRDTSDVAERVALRYIGYNRARRELAERLEVDPYTTNVLLNAQLDELAWSGLAGRAGFGAALGAAGALAEAASISGRLNRLVWELTPDEIRDLNERHLAEAGFKGIRVRNFLRNGHFHPSLQLEFTAALLSLSDAEGRFEFIDLAAEAADELEARFLVNFIRMAQLTQDRDGAPIARIVIDGEAMWVTTAKGSPVLLAPVDYLSVTPWLEALLDHPRLIGRRVTLRVSGFVSDDATARIARAGWQLETRVAFRHSPAYAAAH
ncbi:MAG TPA: hypothetical protein PKZ76_16505 [Xanthomonadaceae bacterium]|nr:hypothetical protein [Xanthomonadaceae bacterium]